MTFEKQTKLLAFTCEVILILGVTTLIFHHYFQQAEGLSVVSTAGVIFTDVVACFALHWLITRYTVIVRAFHFGIWFVLTVAMICCGASVWMATKAQKDIDHKTTMARDAK